MDVDTTAEDSSRRSSFAESSVTVTIPVPSPSEIDRALVPVEPRCLEDSCDSQAVGLISNECGTVSTQFAPTDILNDLQEIYAKVQKAKHDSELAISQEKDKRIDLERQLAEKEEQLQKALADKNSLMEALAEKEDEVESLREKLDEDNERFQELGSILESFRILKADDETEKEIPSKSSVNIETQQTTGNTNPPVFPSSSSSSSNLMGLDAPLSLTEPPSSTKQTVDASVQTESESRITVKTAADDKIKSQKNNHGVDRTKSDIGFYCLCGSEMKTRYDLRDHIRSKDPSSYVFQCSRCDKTFWRTTDLRKHMMKRHQLRYSFYGCRTCGSQFSTFVELLNHHRGVHKFKPRHGYTKRSGTIIVPTRHIQVTSKDPAHYLCSCGKTYSIRKSLTKHIYRSRKLIKEQPVVHAAKKDEAQQKIVQKHGLAKPKSAGCKMIRIRCICSARFESRRELIKHVQRFENSYNKEEEEDVMSDFSCD